ncbi:hypothetical protein L3X38_016212 [Prunus dulcis]|uniref:Uncharacterized protein n=1 Tax=Prunus dulcis TaxID=3755 RepID=A0AAD4W5W6_PRUDU|nr:hypothetical protein L3X38_016212 [Prunus dulcis]
MFRMQPDQNDDTWGGFQMGPNGLILVDEEVYHSRLRNQAYVDVVNEVIDTRYRRMFYTPEIQRLIVRHRLHANNIRSQYQLNIEAHSYDKVLEDAAIIAADIWPPPPGIDLPYVPEPHELNLPQSASVVITEPQNSNPTVINLSYDEENQHHEPVIPLVEIIDISSNDE